MIETGEVVKGGLYSFLEPAIDRQDLGIFAGYPLNGCIEARISDIPGPLAYRMWLQECKDLSSKAGNWRWTQ